MLSPLDQIRGPVITEDTALGFTALKELPGPYIKDFMKAVGHDGESSLPLSITLAI